MVLVVLVCAGFAAEAQGGQCADHSGHQERSLRFSEWLLVYLRTSNLLTFENLQCFTFMFLIRIMQVSSENSSVEHWSEQ